MMYLVQTKACKRCGGDLSLERDHYGTYLACIQCGASSNMQEPANNRHRPLAKRHLQTLATADNMQD
ncbi:hypothetical protein ACFLXD_03050 [Chloroflexota bacterium]